MKKTILLIVFVSLLASINPAKAQLYLKNNTDEPVMVASAIYVKYKGSNYWLTKGWFKVNPNEKKQIASYLGDASNVYYYAKSTISEKEYSGSRKFLVSKDAFTIKNADMEYVKKENPEYYWVGFRKKLGSETYFKLKRTIYLEY